MDGLFKLLNYSSEFGHTASIEGDLHGFGAVLMDSVIGQKPLDISIHEQQFEGNAVIQLCHTMNLSNCGFLNFNKFICFNFGGSKIPHNDD